MPKRMSSSDPAMLDPHALVHMIEAQWTTKHILVVGDVMLDKYIWGDVERISPEAPIPIVRVARTTHQPGGAANVAMNAAAMGARVTLAGVVGEDDDGFLLRSRLKASGIQAVLGVVPDRPTISKTRILGSRQQMLRLDLESSEAMPVPAHEDFLASVLHLLNQQPDPEAAGDSGPVSAVVLSDYAKGVFDERVCQAIIQRARQLTIPVLVDPKGRDFGRYRGATALCPNLAELALATGTPADDLDTCIDAGQKMIERLEVESLVVTLSERGIAVTDGKTRRRFPARARQVFDVSGAGDTVTAVLALCLASRLEPAASMQLANVAAGIVVGKVGTAPVHAEELVAALSAEQSESAEKVFPVEQMARRVKAWKAAGDRVVFTNGCFDLLHSGHISLLEEARRRGDRLIVGLNSDESVRSLKGPARPVVEQEHRARLLAALSAVDGVVLFDEETPLAAILALRPDVLVKGGDYQEAGIVGAREVNSWDGEVVIVPLIAGFSTTGLIAKALA